jgi:hypothetical protein
MWRNITASGADQLRKLAMNVDGISLAGGNEGVASKGTESAIVLRVVRNRARVYWNEKEVKERGVVRAMWSLHRFTADGCYTP